MNLSLGVAIVAVTPLVLSIATEKELGLILSASGFGILAGGLCMTLMKAPKSLVRTIALALTLQGVAYTGMCLSPTVLVLMGTGLVGGFTMTIIYTCSDLLWQHKVQPSVQGKVFGIRPLISALPYPLGFLACGPLVDNSYDLSLKARRSTPSSIQFFPWLGTQLCCSSRCEWRSGLTDRRPASLLRRDSNVERNLNDHVSLFGQVLIKLTTRPKKRSTMRYGGNRLTVEPRERKRNLGKSSSHVGHQPG